MTLNNRLSALNSKLLEASELGINRASVLLEQEDLTPTDLNKLSNALFSFYRTAALILASSPNEDNPLLEQMKREIDTDTDAMTVAQLREALGKV